MAIIAGPTRKRRSSAERAANHPDRGPGGARRGKRLSGRLSALALSALAALPALGVVAAVTATARPARAQTTGSTDGIVGGGFILAEFLGRPGLAQPTGTDFVDFTQTGYAYLKNPYIGVVQGITGTYSVNYGQNFNVTYNVPGMLSFGNVAGALSYSSDNLQALNGLNSTDQIIGGIPQGYGVWPLAANWQTTGGFVSYDYSAYTRVQIDNTVVPILGGDPATLVEGPLVEGNTLRTAYLLANNIRIEQRIRLFNQLARVQWTITNQDTAGHAVRLRFTVCNRSAFSTNPPPGVPVGPTGFFFVDPTRGVTNFTTLLQGANIPAQLPIYGKRFQVDNINDPPFAARHIFRDFGATLPERVYVADPFELRPQAGGFDPVFRTEAMNDGIATAVYYGTFGLAPGGTTSVVTYYGNGVPTERPATDFTIGAEGPESLAYNSGAVTDPSIAGQQGLDPGVVIPKLLTPNPFRVYGLLYNMAQSTPQTSVNLDGVTASLVLPQGLDFALDPVTGAKDVSEKAVGDNGTVRSDLATNASWLVQPTGGAYGLLTYQVSFKTRDFGSRQVSRTISIPATPFRTLRSDAYQMIGFPFEFDPVESNNGDPATVVNGLSTQSQRDDAAAFFKYDPTIRNYLPPVQQLETGVGYFHRASIPRTIFAKGVVPARGQAPLGNTTFSQIDQKQITLQPGWNMIANPYLYDIPLRLLRFVPTQNNPGQQSQNFLGAVNSGLIRAGVFFYNPSTRSYDFFQDIEQPLRPWEGYWLFVNNPVVLIYTLPAQPQSGVIPLPDGTEPPTRKRGLIESGKGFVTRPTSDNWRLHLVARQGSSQQDSATIVGVTNGGEPESSRLIPKPPAPISDYVYVGLVQPNETHRYAKVLQTGAGAKTWDLEVIADRDGPVTLAWPNVNTLPKNVALTLKNVATGRSYSLRGTSSVTINVRKGEATRLQVASRAQAIQRLQITGLSVASSGTSRAAGSQSFVFNLSREARVNLSVKTLTGKTVATVAASRSASAGQNRITWNGRSQNGAALPPGMYRVEVTADAGDGEAPVTLAQPFASLQ